jgi:hypothetical protein
MKALNSLAVVSIIVSTGWTSVLANESALAPVTDAPHVALLSAENDRGLQEAVEALQKRTTESRAAQSGTDTDKHSSALKHRIHRLRKHSEEHVLIMGGPEAFSL